MMKDEIEEFGSALLGVGKEEQGGSVSSFGQDLAEAASCFRIDRMNELFEFFPSIVEAIEIVECQAG